MRNVEKIPVSSTSYAAELASKELGAGAICSMVCADIYGLKVLDRDVEDIKGKNSLIYIKVLTKLLLLFNLLILFFIFYFFFL